MLNEARAAYARPEATSPARLIETHSALVRRVAWHVHSRNKLLGIEAGMIHCASLPNLVLKRSTSEQSPDATCRTVNRTE